MRPVDQAASGHSESHWRAEQAEERRAGQRWGLPAAAAILLLNLTMFVAAPFLVGEITPAVLVLATIAPTVVAVGVFLVLSRVRGHGPVTDLGLPRTWPELFSHVRTGLLWGVVALVGGIVAGAVLLSVHDGPPGEVLGGAGALPTGWKVALALWIVLGAPVGEEVLFRGLLWGALEKRRTAPPRAWAWLGHRWVVLVVTAALFAAWHREWWRLPVLLVGGLALGVARLRSGSVAASSTAHAVNNLLPAVVLLAVA